MKPMLAFTVDAPEKLSFPVLASPKLDGIRCVMQGGYPFSRNLKPIPNTHIRDTLAAMELPALDGELIVGDPKAPDCFNRSTSGIMSRDGTPKFTFWVFDRTDSDAGFRQRLTDVSGMVRDRGGPLRLVAHKLIHSLEDLARYESSLLLAGYEGVMVRHPLGLYKQGRSTAREGGLGKLKRFADAEARIIGFVERQRNDNEQTRDELGRSKRSSAKAGKVGVDTLGALQVRSLDGKVEFEIGTGFDDNLRATIWAERKAWMGKIVKYKSQEVGAMDKPRFPVYLGIRDAADL